MARSVRNLLRTYLCICPVNACSCPAEYGFPAQLKTELRAKAIELGELKATGRQGIITESQQERMDELDT
jgi:hypothetical protein